MFSDLLRQLGDKAWVPIYAALVAGIIAVLIAWVNGRAALRLARENARRDYLLKALTPLLEFSDSRLERIGKVCTAIDRELWDSAEAILKDIEREHLGLRSVAFLSILEQSYTLKRAANDFFHWNTTTLDSLSEMVRDKSGSKSMMNWQIMVAEHMFAAIGQLRVATERYIFKGPTWTDWWYTRSRRFRLFFRRDENTPMK